MSKEHHHHQSVGNHFKISNGQVLISKGAHKWPTAKIKVEATNTRVFLSMAIGKGNDADNEDNFH